ncbi:hypothetical protein V1389_09720 [Flavobacterium rakeshii]|nr:hypothetical protein [Flavobacterium rakeshii]MEE1898615.1 hypothetical protein [Flavobacterium rakeshii]
MTIIFLLSFLCLPTVLLSQIQLIDEKDSIAVPHAHVFLDDVFYTYSKENGVFYIDKKQMFDTLKISHLSYKDKLISYNDFQNNDIVYLEQKNTILNEVFVNYKKQKKRIKTIFPERATRDYIRDKYDILLIDDTTPTIGRIENSDSINISRAVYIPNNDRKHKALIRKIILKSVDKEIENDVQYIPFKVNLMTYDTITNTPKDKILTEDLTVGKKQGETVVIDLYKCENIELPVSGICIVVSVYSQLHYVYNDFIGPPRFDVVSIKKTSGVHEYYLYYSPFWKEPNYSKRREQVFNWGIEVEYID